ncbi:methyltransferase-like protein 2 [Punica granatum]|uniref:Methyltransferase-like protein 2 n=1 Tax=Punica granatum TaxID=22663 RepID=A0A6P8EMH2_PUNGR|nr:methyltransferase-like protein 2 [Punica granatum]
MAEPANSEKLTQFLKYGVYHLESSNAVFIDPVRALNRSYSLFKVSPLRYYSRFFEHKPLGTTATGTCSNSRKRKRKEKRPPLALNERERAADHRHQEVRPFLLKAHESLLRTDELLSVLPNLRSGEAAPAGNDESELPQQSFIELGRLWQASMYEISLNFPHSREQTRDEGCQRLLPIFDNLVANDMDDDVEAEFLGSRYIIPRDSCFYMSDLKHIKNLVPGEDSCGFHLIVIDPPWENGSAQQKSRYPTLPNRYFLSIPIKQLAHEEGALVALWVTNREKLRTFVEKELFPSWGVRHVATFHWLKVKADGSLICDLDLFHHRPYESLLLGYCDGKIVDSEKLPKGRDIHDNQVMISVPGDYSRKPPIEDLVLELVPGLKPPRCIELFAREMRAGWLSWGNEPLYFQESRYFMS